MLTQKATNCIRKFVGWGGLVGVSDYLLQGELLNAVIITLIVGIAVVLDCKYSEK
jgi:hypothetical protein